MVIENSSSLLDDISAILKIEGYETLLAENGKAGLELARAHRPDLIICEVSMPVMDGYMTLLELRSDPAISAIPFVFLTTRAKRGDVRRGMELGADDYITKPFTSRELVASVEANLNRRQNLDEGHDAVLNELRHTLAYALPKDIQVPLDGILKYSEVLMNRSQEIDSQQLVQLSEGIDRAANRMHRMTENYLVFANLVVLSTNPGRVAALRAQVTRTPCEVIKGVSELKGYQEQRIDDMVVECENVPVQIARESLEKITAEIIGNAFKFSSKGTPIHVRAVVHEGSFMLTVTDNGNGMDAAQLTTLEKWEQSPEKLNEPVSSGDLGLRIVKSLVELHNGRLTLNSSSQGTKITIILQRPLDQAV